MESEMKKSAELLLFFLTVTIINCAGPLKGYEMQITINGQHAKGQFLCKASEITRATGDNGLERGVVVRSIGEGAYRLVVSKNEILSSSPDGYEYKSAMTYLSRDKTVLFVTDNIGSSKTPAPAEDIKELYGDSVLLRKFWLATKGQKDGFDCYVWTPSLRRLSKRESEKRFLDVFNFSYHDFFEAVEQLKSKDHVRIGTEVLTVDARRSIKINVDEFKVESLMPKK